MGYMTDGLTFNALRAANEKRMEEWPGNDKVTVEFRGLEVAGEAGELAKALLEVMGNVGAALEALKKYLRAQYGIKGTVTTMPEVALEMGDVLISLDLLAQKLGINLGDAAVGAFNRTSDKYGLRTHIGYDNEWHLREPVDRG